MFTALTKSNKEKDVEDKHDHLEMMLNEIEGKRRRRDIEKEEHFFSLSLSLPLSLSFYFSSSSCQRPMVESKIKVINYLLSSNTSSQLVQLKKTEEVII